LLASAAAAEMFGEDYSPCGDRSNTADIVDCIEAKTKVWDTISMSGVLAGRAMDASVKWPYRSRSSCRIRMTIPPLRAVR
jgi:hypothetical protein